MGREGYSTPEEAARDIGSDPYAEVIDLRLSPSGQAAVVLLLAHGEEYQVVCEQMEGGWFGGAGGNGYGWTNWYGESEINVGVLTLWEKVPEGVIDVVVRWRDEESR